MHRFRINANLDAFCGLVDVGGIADEDRHDACSRYIAALLGELGNDGSDELAQVVRYSLRYWRALPFDFRVGPIGYEGDLSDEEMRTLHLCADAADSAMYGDEEADDG